MNFAKKGLNFVENEANTLGVNPMGKGPSSSSDEKQDDSLAPATDASPAAPVTTEATATGSTAAPSDPQSAGDAAKAAVEGGGAKEERHGSAFGFSTLTSPFTTLASGAASGVGALATGTGTVLEGAAKGTVNLVQETAAVGANIGKEVANSGLDFGKDVGGMGADAVTFAGTAVGGVVNKAAESTGAVFEPLETGLKALGGLDELAAQGVDKVNGVMIGAVRGVAGMTLRAMNMSGKLPTFFDPSGDGVVKVPETVRGLMILGLEEKNAKYAAYALHSIFSYSTQDKWLTNPGAELPIIIKNMSRTRWGKNWGSYDRIEWCQDIDFNDFFEENDHETYAQKWKKGWQYFGIALTIFEWGTTWPFYVPPLPLEEIPFKDDMGKVVRSVVLPTILTNYKRAHGMTDRGGKPDEDAPDHHEKA